MFLRVRWPPQRMHCDRVSSIELLQVLYQRGAYMSFVSADEFISAIYLLLLDFGI